MVFGGKTRDFNLLAYDMEVKSLCLKILNLRYLVFCHVLAQNSKPKTQGNRKLI